MANFFIKCNEVRSCGFKEVSSLELCCLALRAAEQHLPTLPNIVLQRKPNLPERLAAILGVRLPCRMTESIISQRFLILVGFGSAINMRSVVKASVLIATPRTIAMVAGTWDLSGSSLNPKRFKVERDSKRRRKKSPKVKTGG